MCLARSARRGPPGALRQARSARPGPPGAVRQARSAGPGPPGPVRQARSESLIPIHSGQAGSYGVDRDRDDGFECPIHARWKHGSWVIGGHRRSYGRCRPRAIGVSDSRRTRDSSHPGGGCWTGLGSHLAPAPGPSPWRMRPGAGHRQLESAQRTGGTSGDTPGPPHPPAGHSAGNTWLDPPAPAPASASARQRPPAPAPAPAPASAPRARSTDPD